MREEELQQPHDYCLPHVKINLFDLVSSSTKKTLNQGEKLVSDSRLNVSKSTSTNKVRVMYAPPSPIRNLNNFYENNDSFTDLKIITSSYD